MTRNIVAIEGIWLRYIGGENDPHARVVVEVQRGGRWFEVISEPHASAFSHCVTAEGILQSEEALENPPRKRLPTIDEIGGSDPDFTGEMTTAEYIAHIRGYEPAAEPSVAPGEG